MDVDVFDVLIGAGVMPPIIAVLNQARFPSQIKGLVALLACMVCALLVTWLRGPLTMADWRSTAIVVFGSSLVLYRFWWKPSGIAPAIEAFTSARPATVIDAPATEPTVVPGQTRGDL